jgi:hypothetical protein
MIRLRETSIDGRSRFHMKHTTLQLNATLCGVLVWFGALIELASSPASNSVQCLQCDRQMRRTIEAIQAWRRMHEGHYPGRLADLISSDLMQAGGAICPEVQNESAFGDGSHRLASSRLDGGDPAGTYEYEMSDKVLKSRFERRWLPPDSPEYTRQDLKSDLLKRQFSEQVPLLRCTSHRDPGILQAADEGKIWRNATFEGKIYPSAEFWETLWLDQVPYCAREVNVLFGLKGPPFHTEIAPALPQALDLRRWSCAFGDHPWWWTFPMFEEEPNRQMAAQLKPFFEEKHGRSVTIRDEQWWLDGLTQLQGRIVSSRKDVYRGPGMEAFVWQKKGIALPGTIKGASWLQGTVWTAPVGEIAGWLVWHYKDGQSERVPLIYGQSTARFWGDLKQIDEEKDYPEPVWKHHESFEAVGKERWLRVYRQSWVNPRPEAGMATLDFVSNTNSMAAPFLIAVNIKQ